MVRTSHLVVRGTGCVILMVTYTFHGMNEFVSAWKSNCRVFVQFRIEEARGDHLFQHLTQMATLNQTARDLTKKAMNTSVRGAYTSMGPCSTF